MSEKSKGTVVTTVFVLRDCGCHKQICQQVHIILFADYILHSHSELQRFCRNPHVSLIGNVLCFEVQEQTTSIYIVETIKTPFLKTIFFQDKISQTAASKARQLFC